MIKSIKKNYDLIIMCASVVIAIIIRVLCRDIESDDYRTFLVNWVSFFKENGGWHGLRYSVGDYNVVYQYILIIISYINFSDLYLIKLVSCIFDVFLALGCAKCLEAAGESKTKARFCFSLILLLPTVWMNSAYWGQCDSIYVAFIVWSIYFLLKHKNYHSIAFLALAFTFKLQSVFIFPLFFAEFLKKNIKLRHIAVFPVTYFITCIPALIFGKSFWDIISIYFNQTTEYPQMVMSAPSLMQIFELVKYNEILAKLGILAAFIFAFGLSIISFKKKNFDAKHILALCLLMTLGVPFFLPHMHDRYFYMAGIFAVCYAFAFGKKRIWVVVLAEVSSLIFYLHYFSVINLHSGVISSHLLSYANGATLMFFVLTGAVILYFYDFSKRRINLKYAMIISFTLIVAISAAAQSITAQRRIISKVDGKLANHCGVTSIEKDGCLMIPLRTVFNTGGFVTSYDVKTASIKMEKHDKVIFVNTFTGEAVKNGETVTLSHPCVIENNCSFISKDDAAYLMDMSVEKKGNVLYFESYDK